MTKALRKPADMLVSVPGGMLAGAIFGQNPARPSVAAGQPHPVKWMVNAHAKRP
jgi:hypothetical protein